MKLTRQGHAFTEIVLEAFKFSGLLTTEGDKLTQIYGLSSARWKIIGALERSQTALTVPQIARVMGQSRQAVQRLADSMHKDGLVVFIDNPKHKRAKLVTLTIEGTNAYAKLEQLQIPWANGHSSEIDEKELEITLTTLKKLSEKFGP